MSTWQDKTILITGASSGIGAAAARLMARQGALVLLVARRAEALAALQQDILELGGRAAVYPADLSTSAGVEALADQVLLDHPHIDVLINNAGRSIRREVRESLQRPHDFERTMALNYHAAVRLCLRLLPDMLARNSGQIINVSSQSTQLPMPRYAAYVASKSALEGFSRSLTAELATTGVAVTVVKFPLVRTPMSTATSIYRRLPMLTPEEAAGWLVHAVNKRPARLSTSGGRLWELSTAAAPGLTSALTGRLAKVVTRRLSKQAP